MGKKFNKNIIMGFGTGCFYKNLEPVSIESVNLIKDMGCDVIEFCAIKPERLDYFDGLNAGDFKYISLHAPDIEYKDDFSSLEILNKIEKLHRRFNFKTIVFCPNFVKDFSVFNKFDFPISFENMDKRRDFGKNVEDMKKVFYFVPRAKFVLDLTHVFTNDNSMELVKEFVKNFRDKLVEIHLSGYLVHSDGDEQQHYPIYLTEQKKILDSVLLDVPIIIESVFPKTENIRKEIFRELEFIEKYLELKENLDEEFFERLKEGVLPYFEGGDGHDFEHIERVYNMALNISEGEDVDLDVVRAAVLLHDIARGKETDENKVCHAEEGAKMAFDILKDMKFPDEKIEKVVHAIAVHRYSKGLKAESREAEILQDADRLDALGAVIIVRMLQYAAKYNLSVYDSNVPIKEKYDGLRTTVINHIYEKLLKLEPSSFRTEKAREIARGRYDFVKEFAERYVGEVEGRL